MKRIALVLNYVLINVFAFTFSFGQTEVAKINFTNSSYSETGWANYTSLTVGSSIDLGGGLTLTNISASNLIAGSYGIISGTSFPDNVAQTYHYINTGDNADKTYRVSGLSQSQTYNFEFFGSRLGSGAIRLTNYTIGGTTVSLDADNNADNSVFINNVASDVAGTITFMIRKDASAEYGYINGMRIYANGGTPPTQYTLSTSTSGSGSIGLSPTGGVYNSGTVVTLTATPGSGYQFSGWGGDLSGSTNPTTITMNSNKSVTATFTVLPPNQYTLTTNVTGSGSITLNPSGGIYTSGTTVEVTAIPSSGYDFSGWSGDLSGSTNPTSITMNSNKTITATFTGGSGDSYWLPGTGGIYYDGSAGMNVGIGISNPSERLHINGSIRGNQTGGALRVKTSFGYLDIGPKNSTCVQFYTDMPLYYFDKEVRINSGQIGSYDEDLELRVSGSTKLTLKANGDAKFIGNIDIPTDKNLRFGYENDNTGFLLIHNATCCYNTFATYKGNLYFRVHQGDGRVTMGLQNDGTVVIGTGELYVNGVTNTSGNKLMVNGGILCKSLDINSDIIQSDFVFEEDYYLRPLGEVEAFIQTNKHLPEIPSSEEFRQYGYNVAKMDDLLLRKIEELTLYIINLQKENNELQGKIEILESRIK